MHVVGVFGCGVNPLFASGSKTVEISDFGCRFFAPDRYILNSEGDLPRKIQLSSSFELPYAPSNERCGRDLPTQGDSSR